jgi:hypothetical protein
LKIENDLSQIAADMSAAEQKLSILNSSQFTNDFAQNDLQHLSSFSHELQQ